MPKEYSAVATSAEMTTPQRPKVDSGEFPIARPKNLPPANDIELGEEDILEADVDDIEQAALTFKQAEQLAKDFPGLLLDPTARQEHIRALANRSQRLSDKVNLMREDILNLKRFRLAQKLKGPDVKSLHSTVSAQQTELEKTESEIDKLTEQENYFNARPTADDDVQGRIDDLKMKLEATTNKITQQGLEAKIRKLGKIQQLLQEARVLRPAEEKEAEFKSELKHVLSNTETRPLRPEPSETSKPAPEKPKREPLTAEEMEENALIARHHEFQQEQKRERNQKLLLLQQQRADYERQLEELASKLEAQGETVELPWQPGSTPEKPPLKSSPLERLGQNLRGGWKDLTSRLRGQEPYSQLKQQWQIAMEGYQSADEAYAAVKHNAPAVRPIAVESKYAGAGSESNAVAAKRFEQQMVLEQAQRDLKKIGDEVRDVTTMVLTGKNFQGQELHIPELRAAMPKLERDITSKTRHAVVDKDEVLAKQKDEVKRGFIYLGNVFRHGRQLTALHHQRDYAQEQRLADIQRKTKHRLEVLAAQAEIGKNKKERDAAKRALGEVQNLVGGTNVADTAKRVTMNCGAALGLEFVPVNSITLDNLLDTYGLRLARLVATLGGADTQPEMAAVAEELITQRDELRGTGARAVEARPRRSLPAVDEYTAYGGAGAALSQEPNVKDVAALRRRHG